MKLFLVLFVLVVACLSRECPVGCLCKWTRDDVKCSCLSSASLVLANLTDVRRKQFTVENCEYVQVETGAFSQMHLTSLDLRNVEVLVLKPFAFHNVDHLYLEHVSDLQLEPNSIDMRHVRHFAMDNATVRSVPENSIFLDDVRCTNKFVPVVEKYHVIQE